MYRFGEWKMVSKSARYYERLNQQRYFAGKIRIPHTTLYPSKYLFTQSWIVIAVEANHTVLKLYLNSGSGNSGPW